MSSFPKDWPKDITRESVQSYLLNFYSSPYAPKHQELSGVGNRCKPNTSNSSNSTSLSFPQSVVNTVMKGFASVDTTNRGILVWHSLGSGKTCSATAAMEAFWDTDKNIVFATSVEASNSNPPSNFHKCAMNFFPRFKGKSIEQVKKEFEKRKVSFFTFATLSHYLLIGNPLKSVKKEEDIIKHKNFLKNAVLVIDEVHNIFKPLPNQKVENDAVKKFLLDYNNPYTTDLKIVILTATPGDTPTDVVALLNMVRDRKAPLIEKPDVSNPDNLKKFESEIAGLVSYFDMSKDYTRFPRVIQDRPTKTPMSYKQFSKYAQVYNHEPNNIKNANVLLEKNEISKYYKHARKYSNMLYNLDKDMLIGEFSSKLPMLINTIKEYPNEKHYIYSSFYENRGNFHGQGILAIAKTLEDELGFTKLTQTDAQKMETNINNIDKKPRYILAISSELNDNRENLKKLVNAFNKKENARGEYIQLFLASQNYNEGLDLKATKHVHIFEPLLTMAADKQTIGRSARYCSHSDLDFDKGEWTVKVHRYLTEKPDDMSMFNMGYFRDRIEYMKSEIDNEKNRMEEMKGKEYATTRDELKKDIVEYNKMVRELERKYKELDKLNLKNVKQIDEQITNEALARANEMNIIYDIMKRQAIDRLLFREYLDSSF
jgi:hypothetical protein